MKKEVITAAVCKATSLGCLIATIGVLARTITGVEFGIYMLYLGTIQLAAVVTQLGLHQAIMRRLAERLERQEKTKVFIYDGLRKVLVVSSAIVCVGSLVIWQAGIAVQDEAGNRYLALGAGWAILAAMQLAIADSFKAFRLSTISFIYGETGTALTTFALVLISVVFGQTITLTTIFAISIFAAGIFTILGASHLLIHAKKQDAHARDATDQLVGYSSGWRICLAYSLVLGVYPVILWFAGYYGSVEIAGQFALSHKLATLIVLPMLVTNSMMPRRIIGYRLSGNGKHEIQKLSLLTTVVAMMGFITIVLAGDFIVNIWLGTYQTDIASMAVLIQTGKLVTVIFGASNIILIGYNQEHRFLEAGLITILVLILILYLPYELNVKDRIVAASVCSAVMHAAYQFFYSRKAIGFFYPFPQLTPGHK